jgi:hypothetical protein
MTDWMLPRKTSVQMLIDLVRDCQDVLATTILPENGDSDAAVNRLLEILDGPQWRACRDALREDGFSV